MTKHHTHHGYNEGSKPEKPQTGAAESGQAAEFSTESTDNFAAAGVKKHLNEAESEQIFTEEGVEQSAEAESGEKIAELEMKLAEITDQLLRKAADFENFRKRMNQDKQNAIEYANQSLLLDIIPVIDDFERAIQSAESSKDFAGFLDGVKIIEKQLVSQLESKWGLKRFNSAGELFDPNIHEALMVEKTTDVTEAVVREDLIKGYLLKDRLIRAAKVKVAMPEA